MNCLSRPRISLLSIMLAISLLPLAAGAVDKDQVDTVKPSTGATSTLSDAEIMAKAPKLYYSTKAAGLDGFECALRPDWIGIFTSAHKDPSDAANRVSIALLDSVKITLHANMKGGSGLDWQLPTGQKDPLSLEQTNLLNSEQQAIVQMMQGFMQFWTPFVDGSLEPSQADAGTAVKSTDTGYTLHVESGEVAVTETLDKDLLLQRLRVLLKGSTVDADPVYFPTKEGLLVKRFLVHIQPSPGSDGNEMKMDMGVEYQTVDEVFIPSKLMLSVVGTGEFIFTLDGCKLSRSKEVHVSAPPAH